MKIAKLLVLVTICALLFCGCGEAVRPPESAAPTVPASTIPEVEADPFVPGPESPLFFWTLERLHHCMETGEGLFPEWIEEFALDTLAFYFKPVWLPETADLRSVRIKDRYVALYYAVGDLTGELDMTSDGKEELMHSFMFEWVRLPDGDALLRSSIEPFELQPLDGVEGVWWSSCTWYEQPEMELGRQYYWVAEGYQFSMYVPNGALNDGLSFGVERVSLNNGL